jgi:hypothetical protein
VQGTTLDQATGIALSIAQTLWRTHQRAESGFPRTLLVALAFWLTLVVVSFDIFAPRNAFVVVGLFLFALSISGAVLVILETCAPELGWIRISSGPRRATAAHPDRQAPSGTAAPNEQGSGQRVRHPWRANVHNSTA